MQKRAGSARRAASLFVGSLDVFGSAVKSAAAAAAALAWTAVFTQHRAQWG